MYTNKLSAQLQLALRYENLFNTEMRNRFVRQVDGKWEIIIQYRGDIKRIGTGLEIDVHPVSDKFCYAYMRREDVSIVAESPFIIYMSLPQMMTYIDIGLSEICAGNLTNPVSNFNVTGQGILLGVVDTGIKYNHPDFINDDGSSRILYLWDQTIEGTPPVEFERGAEYTREDINSALAEETEEGRLSIVPSEDVIGHGTALAGIAGGNGRGSINRINRGVAPDCELIVVKVGRTIDDKHPGDLDIMIGIQYVLQKAEELGRPVVVLIGVGNNLTGHDGTSVLEQYIDEVAVQYICNIVVGVGNQGDKNSHAEGQLQTNTTDVIQLLMGQGETNYGLCIWRQFADVVSLILESPQGERTEVLNRLTINRAYIFDQTTVLINFSEPSIDAKKQEILILLIAPDDGTVNSGIWTIRLIGNEILEGKYNAWGEITEVIDTGFVGANPNKTLTSPSTARSITGVAAYNGLTRQIATFSGRGYTRDEMVKPDITAPGINIIVPSISTDQLYARLTGTSAAGAFVAGAYIILLAYGLGDLSLDYLYGETLKIYLLRSARRLPEHAPYPNPSWGYGIACVTNALNEILEVSHISI